MDSRGAEFIIFIHRKDKTEVDFKRSLESPNQSKTPKEKQWKHLIKEATKAAIKAARTRTKTAIRRIRTTRMLVNRQQVTKAVITKATRARISNVSKTGLRLDSLKTATITKVVPKETRMVTNKRASINPETKSPKTVKISKK